jgi:hypothetical protein
MTANFLMWMQNISNLHPPPQSSRRGIRCCYCTRCYTHMAWRSGKRQADVNVDIFEFQTNLSSPLERVLWISVPTPRLVGGWIHFGVNCGRSTSLWISIE